MAAHRYWRARLSQAYDGGTTVELSEFWLLFNGSRVDAGATLTSDVAPVSGTLSNLSDNNTATAAVLTVGTVLQWDFGGSPSDVDDIRLGSGDTSAKFLGAAEVAYSDDGSSWTVALNAPYEYPVWYAWPGTRSLTTSVDDRNWTTEFGLVFTIDPSDGRLATGSSSRHVRGAARRSTGVRQFEVVRSTWSSLWLAGIIRSEEAGTAAGSANAWVIRAVDGTKASFGSAFTSYPTGGWSASDVMGVVIDFGTGTMTYYKNGASLGAAFTNLSGETVRPFVAAPGGSETATLRTNGFAYPVVGAEPWTRAVIAYGARSDLRDILASSNGGYSLGHEMTIGSAPQYGRPNFMFDPAARGRIVGTVKRKDTPDNVPLSRRVRLYRDRDGMFVAETWSDAAGNYQFDYIEENESYTAIAHDHTYFYRAVAADNLSLANGTLELIP